MSLFEIALTAVAALVLWSIALWAHLYYWDRKLGVSMSYALEERIATADGTAIELRRLPAPDAPAELPPVILVHGLGANHRNNDLHPDHSLARYLRSLGRDVWLVTLRSGMSRLTRAESKLVRFAAMVRHDLPLAIETVLARCATTKLDYIGFSMGGMLLYAAIDRSVQQEKLRRVVIIGSPILVRAPWPVPRWVTRVPYWIAPTMRYRFLARAGAFASEWVHTPLHRAMLNPKNVAPGMARLAMANLVADVPAGLNLDFAAWAVSPNGALTLDGEAVLEKLAQVKAPALFFAGVADLMAPPASVRAAFEAWGSSAGTEKCFVLLGREYGAEEDYGHGDLAVGTHARKDVFEPIGAFLGDPPQNPAHGERTLCVTGDMKSL